MAMLLAVVAAIALLVAMPLAFVLYNFPWITRYWRPTAIKLSIGGEGAVAFVSDVHIGSSRLSAKAKLIGRALSRLRARTLVVVGDLIDDRLAVELNSLEKIARLVVKALGIENATLIYIASSSAHDIAVKGLGNGYARLRIDDVNVDFLYTANHVELAFDGCSERVYAAHGDYVSRDGTVSYLMDRVGRKLLGKAITGLVARRVLGLSYSYWVVLGHSHVSCIDRSHKTVVLGSWVKRVYAPRESSMAVASCTNGRLKVVMARFD